MSRRYVAVIDFYIIAESDDEARIIAEQHAAELRYQYDNSAKTLALYQPPANPTEEPRYIKPL